MKQVDLEDQNYMKQVDEAIAKEIDILEEERKAKENAKKPRKK